MRKTITKAVCLLMICTLTLSSCSVAPEESSEVYATPYLTEPEIAPEIHEPETTLAPEPEPTDEEIPEAEVRTYPLRGRNYVSPLLHTLPVAQGEYDLQSIIGRGQYAITWEMQRSYIPEYISPFNSVLEYPVFDEFPHAETTDIVNQAIRDFVYLHYYQFLEDLEQREESRYAPAFGARVFVSFANPQLVSIFIDTGVTYFRHHSANTTLNFNPTTGERYRLDNFIDINLEILATIFYGERMLGYDEETQEMHMLVLRGRNATYAEDGVAIFRRLPGMGTFQYHLTFVDLAPFLFTNAEEATDSGINSLPVAQGEYDLLSIIQRGQYGITWETRKYPTGPAESGWVNITYAVFDEFLNAEITDVINQHIRDFALRLYYNYLEDNENREQDDYFRYPGHFQSGANVLFANPQLVSIRIWTSVTFRRPWDDDAILNFNPTTGEWYNLGNFVNLTPELVVDLRGDWVLDSDEILQSHTESLRHNSPTISEDGIGIFLHPHIHNHPTYLTFEELAPFLFTND